MDKVFKNEIPTYLPKPRLWPWLQLALFDWMIIGFWFLLAYFIINASMTWPYKLLLLFPVNLMIGSRQTGLGLLGHDGAHRLITRHRILNDWLTVILCFAPLQAPLEGYRRFHFDHHRFVGTDKDPELIHKKSNLQILGWKFLRQWEAPLKPWQLVVTFLFDFLGGSIPHIIMGMYLVRPVSFKDFLPNIIFSSILFGLSWWFHMLWIPIMWFTALFTSYWAMFRLRLWTEHVATNGTHLVKANAWQGFLFLPHNTSYHYEHHEYLSVPCWGLKQTRSADAPEISVGELFKAHFKGESVGFLNSEKSRQL